MHAGRVRVCDYCCCDVISGDSTWTFGDAVKSDVWLEGIYIQINDGAILKCWPKQEPRNRRLNGFELACMK